MSQLLPFCHRLLRTAVANASTALLATLLLCTGASHALAQSATGALYDVELIVFRNLENQSTEHQPAGTALPAEDEQTTLEGEDGAPPAHAPTAQFPALPMQRLQLGNLADGLRRSAGYRPLAHVGWTQPAQARDAAQYLDIASLAPDAGLQGRVAITLGRFLHLTVDLSHLDQNGQRVAIQQSRRMRSNERHYLDSPALGIIAIITPSQGQ